uniref:Uncharacterized protein n=1 Tax=viral metagenome TaxID=1070528 RepID=A0A6C0DZU2_9ZZZZ
MSSDSVNALLRRVDQAIANAKLNLNKDQDGGKKKRRRRRSKSVNKLLTEFNGGDYDDQRVDLLSGGKRSKKSKASKKTKKTKKSKKSKKSKKMGRGANTFIADMSALRTYIKTKLSKPLNHLSLTKACSKLLMENDKNLDKAKKAFNETEFMKLYNKCDKERNENKASKK